MKSLNTNHVPGEEVQSNSTVSKLETLSLCHKRLNNSHQMKSCTSSSTCQYCSGGSVDDVLISSKHTVLLAAMAVKVKIRWEN